MGSTYVSLGVRGGRGPLPRAAGAESPGAVLRTNARLAAGRLTATVRLRAAASVVLSASHDPGWTATVDGRAEPTVMVAPALVAVRVPAGTHTVAFTYRGYRGYPLLLALGGLTLFAVLVAELAGGGRLTARGRVGE